MFSIKALQTSLLKWQRAVLLTVFLLITAHFLTSCSNPSQTAAPSAPSSIETKITDTVAPRPTSTNVITENVTSVIQPVKNLDPDLIKLQLNYFIGGAGG